MPITNQTTDATVIEELGRRLERTRLDRNLTQEQLAAEAGVSRQTVVRLESGGVVKLPALVRVLRAMGMLDRLEALVPQPVPSPIEQLERGGRQRKRARKAAPKKDDGSGTAEGWTWGTP
jgi:transcriptional regulator with XRE-family HTH domain